MKIIKPYTGPSSKNPPHSEPDPNPSPNESDSIYSPSAVHSAPGGRGSTPVQFISVQPNREEEIEEVAAEYLSIVLYNGPLTTATQSYGTKSIAAVREAHLTIFNLPSTKTLSATPDDATIDRVCYLYHALSFTTLIDTNQILVVAGLLIARLVNYVRKRFPTDWKINPPASKGYAVGSEAYTQYQVARINQYMTELNFTRAEPGTEVGNTISQNYLYF